MESASCVRKSLPFVAMIVAEFMIIGCAALTKATITSGLSQYVFLVYSGALGTIILLPWFVCHCLSGKRLPLTLSLLCRFFSLGLIGSCLSPILLVTGLSYTSVTVGAAIGNLNPIFTYLIAICLRMEMLNLRKSTDQIKALGTFVAVLGAFVVTLYKGPALLVTDNPSSTAHKLVSEQSNWQLGCLLFVLGYLLRPMWNILQADTAKLYPDEVTIVFFCNLFGAILTAIASCFLVKSQSAWKLHLQIEIISIVYTAFAMSVFTNIVITWCLRQKGPVFVSMFDPLNVALAVVVGSVFLGDGIYLGSLVGAATIVVGFYAVMWGKEKTTSAIANKIGGLESGSSQVAPLLMQSSLS